MVAANCILWGMNHPFNIYSLGDQALTIEIGSSIEESINQRCIFLSQQIAALQINGIIEIIPAYTTVTVVYDAVKVSSMYHTLSPSTFLKHHLQKNLTINDEGDFHSSNKKLSIPACFETEVALDIEAIAVAKNISTESFITKFTATPYRVYMLGFLPGFPYMGRVNDDLAMPRKDKPHTNITTGSIGIAGNQTGIYTLNSPGGWNIIGRTPLKIFDKDAADPCLLQAGDIVTFERISLARFNEQNENK